MSLYRSVLKKIAWPLVYRAGLLNRPIHVDGNLFRGEVRGETQSKPRAHFHAASAGELEILWPVIFRFISDGHPVRVSVFSASGERSLKRLYEDWVKLPSGKGSIELGFSPVEGNWSADIARTLPAIFITAKYEAWPELWGALAQHHIPLLIVGAKARSSFRWAKRIGSWIGESQPQIDWVGEAVDREGLLDIFPKSHFTVASDPRWDRVRDRLQGSQSSSLRTQEFDSALSARGESFGVLGSFWQSDVPLVLPELSKQPGLVLCVPHDVSPEYAKKLRGDFEKVKLRVWTSNGRSPSERDAKQANIWIINELGILVELYRLAQWIYVGGGFEKGVHSTIEAAFSGSPVAAGPKKFKNFSENMSLSLSGQLSCLESSAQFTQWLRQSKMLGAEKRNLWKQQAHDRCGGTEEVYRLAKMRMEEK